MMPKKNDLYIYLGGKIQEKRKEFKISQEKLAEILNTDYVQIYRYEKGIRKIPFDKLLELATFFNVSLEYFYDGFNKKENKKNPVKSNPELEKEIMMLKEIYDYNDENLIYVAKTNIELAYGLLKKERRVRKNAGNLKKKMA